MPTTTENEVLVNIPFNESAGSNVAFDYSGKNADAHITGGEFIPGRLNNSVHFPGVGYAEILAKVIPVSGVYTFCLWARAQQLSTSPNDTWLLVKFAGDERFVYIDLATPLTSWTYICLIQGETSFTVNLNSHLIGQEAFPAGWGKPTGWCLLNDNPSDSAGYCSLEDLTVYDGIVSGEIVTPPTAMDLLYFINGLNFTLFGVNVSDSDGIIDNLNMKEPFKVDWPDYHGEVLDLSRPRYEAREITLSCFISGVGRDEFLDRVKNFMAQFEGPYTKRLHVSAHSTKPLVFEVYLMNSVNLKKKWSNSLMVGTFELKLREPEPIKRVLKWSGGAGCQLSFTSAKMVTIYWGNGDATRNVYGNFSLTYNFSPGEYYIIIAGVIEEITNFSSNASVVWSKL